MASSSTPPSLKLRLPVEKLPVGLGARVLSFFPQTDAAKAAAAASGSIAGRCTNKVITAKYTPLNFLFKCGGEQFSNLSNVYFLIIIVIAYVGTFTSSQCEGHLGSNHGASSAAGGGCC